MKKIKAGGAADKIVPLSKTASRIQKSKKKKKIDWKGKAWEAFSDYIRLRDADDHGNVNCISCDIQLHWKDSQAGHYIPKSLGAFFLLNEDDVHAQCYSCNVCKHGNLIQYRRNLIYKVGTEMVETLEYQSQMGIREDLNKVCKYTEEDYKDFIRIYKDKIAELKKVKFWERQ